MEGLWVFWLRIRRPSVKRSPNCSASAPTTVDPAGNLIGQGLDSIRMMSLAGVATTRHRRRLRRAVRRPTIEAWSDWCRRHAARRRSPARRPPMPTAPSTCAFPLAPMQHAMWVGRHDSQPLGGVAGHLYVEFDGGAIDPERLARRPPRWRCGIRCCGCGFCPTAPSRSIGRRRGDFPVAVHDFRDLAEDAAGERLIGLRDAKSHQQLDGQVFELTLSLLPGEKSRLHVDLDMQAADAMSYRTLMSDLAKLYQGRQLPELATATRSTATRSARGKRPRPARDADRDWWSQRIPRTARTRPRCRRQTGRH